MQNNSETDFISSKKHYNSGKIVTGIGIYCALCGVLAYFFMDEQIPEINAPVLTGVVFLAIGAIITIFGLIKRKRDAEMIKDMEYDELMYLFRLDSRLNEMESELKKLKTYLDSIQKKIKSIFAEYCFPPQCRDSVAIDYLYDFFISRPSCSVNHALNDWNEERRNQERISAINMQTEQIEDGQRAIKFAIDESREMQEKYNQKIVKELNDISATDHKILQTNEYRNWKMSYN